MQGVCNRHGTKRRGSTLRKTRDSGCQEHFKRTSLWLSSTFTFNAREAGLIPGLGRFPGEGNGNPLQCSCLENPMDGGDIPVKGSKNNRIITFFNICVCLLCASIAECFV